MPVSDCNYEYELRQRARPQQEVVSFSARGEKSVVVKGATGQPPAVGLVPHRLSAGSFPVGARWCVVDARFKSLRIMTQPESRAQSVKQ